MSNTHAFLPPSGAHSWSKCAMWPTMNAKFPQEDTVSTLEGTAAHWVAWEMLANRAVSVGMKTPNGQIVTEEMLEGGELLVDTIIARMHWAPLDGHVEEKLEVPYIKDCFGTPDWWSYSPQNLHIEIVDYKFGHRFVDEFWNPQGLLYATAIINSLDKSSAWFEQAYTISFTIVQPRCFYKGKPVRTHTYRLTETLPYLEDLYKAAQSAVLPEPTATTNEYCGDCPGRHSCSVLQQAAYNGIEYSNSRTPIMLSPVAAALELKILKRAADRIKARVDGLEEQTLANLKAGRRVDYFRAEPGYGRQVWTIPDSQVVSLGKLYGKDLSKSVVVTPKQAEKAGVDPTLVKSFSFTPTTGFRLIAENPTDAAHTFGFIKEDGN
jgi:Protein of unknown function (DUF2800)